MSSIDERIRKALAEEDSKVLSEIEDEAGLFDLLGMFFSGKQSWLNWLISVITVATFVAILLFIRMYVNAEDLQSRLDWGLWIIGGMIAMVILKIQGFQQLAKLEIMREIKRLEMRVELSSGRDKDSS